MTEISLIEVYKIVDSFFKYFEGNFLVEHFGIVSPTNRDM